MKALSRTSLVHYFLSSVLLRSLHETSVVVEAFLCAGVTTTNNRNNAPLPSRPVERVGGGGVNGDSGFEGIRFFTSNIHWDVILECSDIEVDFDSPANKGAGGEDDEPFQMIIQLHLVQPSPLSEENSNNDEQPPQQIPAATEFELLAPPGMGQRRKLAALSGRGRGVSGRQILHVENNSNRNRSRSPFPLPLPPPGEINLWYSHRSNMVVGSAHVGNKLYRILDFGDGGDTIITEIPLKELPPDGTLIIPQEEGGGHNRRKLVPPPDDLVELGIQEEFPITPPEEESPVTPPEEEEPVTPPEEEEPVTPPEEESPVTPPEEESPVTPPEEQVPVALVPSLSPINIDDGNGNGNGSDDDTEVVYMDLLVPYTKRTLCHLGTGVSDLNCDSNDMVLKDLMEAFVELAVYEANLSLTNSGIYDKEFRLLKTYLIEDDTFDEFSLSSEGIGDPMARLLSGMAKPGDGLLEDVPYQREEVGADAVLLLQSLTDRCGLAYQGKPIVDSQWMYAVVNWECATGYYSFGHELFHLLGASHDRFANTENCLLPPPSSPGDDSSPCCIIEDFYTNCFSFGYMDLETSLWRTIMSYDCPGDGMSEEGSGASCPRILMLSQPVLPYKLTIAIDDGDDGNGGGARGLRQRADLPQENQQQHQHRMLESTQVIFMDAGDEFHDNARQVMEQWDIAASYRQPVLIGDESSSPALPGPAVPTLSPAAAIGSSSAPTTLSPAQTISPVVGPTSVPTSLSSSTNPATATSSSPAASIGPTLPPAPTAPPVPTSLSMPTLSPAPIVDPGPTSTTFSPAPVAPSGPTRSPAPIVDPGPTLLTLTPAPDVPSGPTRSPAPIVVAPGPTRSPAPVVAPGPTLTTVAPGSTISPAPVVAPGPTLPTVAPVPIAAPGPTRSPAPIVFPGPTSTTVSPAPIVPSGPTRSPAPIVDPGPTLLTQAPAPAVPSEPTTTTAPTPIVTAEPTLQTDSPTLGPTLGPTLQTMSPSSGPTTPPTDVPSSIPTLTTVAPSPVVTVPSGPTISPAPIVVVPSGPTRSPAPTVPSGPTRSPAPIVPTPPVPSIPSAPPLPTRSPAPIVPTPPVPSVPSAPPLPTRSPAPIVPTPPAAPNATPASPTFPPFLVPTVVIPTAPVNTGPTVPTFPPLPPPTIPTSPTSPSASLEPTKVETKIECATSGENLVCYQLCPNSGSKNSYCGQDGYCVCGQILTFDQPLLGGFKKNSDDVRFDGGT